MLDLEIKSIAKRLSWEPKYGCGREITSSIILIESSVDPFHRLQQKSGIRFKSGFTELIV